MELLIVRRKKTTLSTIGDMYVDGVKKWVTLEDTDRGLTNQMTLAQIAAIKVKGTTAIPTGRYRVVKYNSPTRGWCLLVEDVPGFSMIEMHVGNYSTDSDGCILVGTRIAENMITNSKIAIKELYSLTFPVLEKGDELWATVV